MPSAEGRQYRYFNASNFTPVEDRHDAYAVRGYFTTFDDPYEIAPGLFEVIDRHALDDTDLSDVIMQYDHKGMVMARNRNKSLSLFIDDHGAGCEASLSGCQQARDLYEAIANGLVEKMSWGFIIPDDGFEYDPATRTSTIKKVAKVFDVSAVSIPANPGTDIQMRSYLDGAIQAAQLAERQAAEDGAILEREKERMRAIVRMNLA